MPPQCPLPILLLRNETNTDHGYGRSILAALGPQHLSLTPGLRVWTASMRNGHPGLVPDALHGKCPCPNSSGIEPGGLPR